MGVCGRCGGPSESFECEGCAADVAGRDDGPVGKGSDQMEGLDPLLDALTTNPTPKFVCHCYLLSVARLAQFSGVPRDAALAFAEHEYDALLNQLSAAHQARESGIVVRRSGS